ncbi:MAG TPA: threonine/serine dehydratase [Gammaproteobacteria bacterium]|nr:threonine/serine dehydratase [Gammaproteobacteria bacterium]
MSDIKNEVLIAENRIRPYIRQTPLDFSLPLSKITNANVYLKCENLQYTGAFKARGAFNKLLSLTPEQLKQGIVAASSGNHGAAMAFALHTLKIPGIIFVPENASPTKIDNIRNYDIPLEFYATDCMQTENYARAYAKQRKMLYVSPYNDLQVLAGQGTIALEIAAQLDKVDAILVPIGGGGLISGIAGYIKAVSPNTQVIGCLPENSPVMAESVKAGKILDMPTYPTLSDATAGGIESGAITFDICKQLVDDYIVASEQEIKAAIIALIKTQHILVEGAAGVALSALLKNSHKFRNKNVVIVLSGANISLDTLKNVLT